MTELDPAVVENALDYLERARASLATLAEQADEPGLQAARDRLVRSVQELGAIIGALEGIDGGPRPDQG